MKLVEEFNEIAIQAGKTIISELFLSVDDKTIKPIDAGGIAGGNNNSIVFSYEIHIPV